VDPHVFTKTHELLSSKESGSITLSLLKPTDLAKIFAPGNIARLDGGKETA
jgi:hypothetical protein